MKKMMVFVITLYLPFTSYCGILDLLFKRNNPALQHAGEIAAHDLKEAAESIENLTNRACDTAEEWPSSVRQETENLLNAFAIVALIGYGVYKAGEYTAYGVSTTYKYMNGTLEAERAEQKRLEEEANAKAEEARLKAFIATQEAARIKRNAEIETEFNQCYMSRFGSPTRKRNGIPSSCELQAMQLVSTGKFKSMQDLRDYYKS